MRHNVCSFSGCKVIIASNAKRCSIHLVRKLSHLEFNIKPLMTAEFSLEDSIEIPESKRSKVSELREKLRILAFNGRIGQSFTIFSREKVGASYIGSVAKKEGVIVMVRKLIPLMKHPAKKGHVLFRVWRTDGKTREEINELIKK